MLNENKIEELVEVINKSFNCITDVEFWSVKQKKKNYKTEVQIGIINVDDRIDDVHILDNNKHNLKDTLKSININVVSKPIFKREDAYPDGTSYYSLRFIIDKSQEG